MKGFEDITLSWGGETYTIPADRMLRIIAEVEEIIRAGKVEQAAEILLTTGPGVARLSQAYGACLRYAGANVSDDEVYLTINQSIATSNADMFVAIQEWSLTLLSMLSPPIREALKADTDAEKKSTLTE